MAKYTPLQEYLSGLPDDKKEITLAFEQIDRIIYDKLPFSAHHHRAWWANETKGQHVEAKSWLNAGWKVDAVDQKQKWVRFVRI